MTAHVTGYPNFRSLAGLPTVDGRTVREGVLYRSESLAGLDETAQRELAAQNIVSVCDLRSPGERNLHPLVWPGEQPHLVPVEVLPDTRVAGKELIHSIMADPTGQRLTEILMGNAADMPGAFRDSMRTIYTSILDEERLPLLIMCVAGKDRTGFVTANILRALDVEWDAIVEDYLATKNFIDKDKLHRSMVEYLDDAPSEVLSADDLVTMGSRTEYLDESFKAIDREFGSYERYLVDICGLTPQRREQLQGVMLE